MEMENEYVLVNKVPVGYRFDPTDEELVSFYLMNKIYGKPLPYVIQEYDVFLTEPWKLPTLGEYDIEERKYFFHISGGHIFNNTDKRVAGFGEWRMVEEKEIVLPNKEFMGKRNTLIFWDTRTTHCGIQTRWTMHQFLLSSTANSTMVSSWGAYRIFKMERGENVERKGKEVSSSNEPSTSLNLNLFLKEDYFM